MQFKNILGAAIMVASVAMLVGCGGGKGVDARLSTNDEPGYRMSLAVAWQDMSAEQQRAYNWAVSGIDLYQLMARFPNSTPRKMVEEIAGKYIEETSAELKKLELEYAADLPKIERQEKELAEVKAELAKITVTAAKLDHSNRQLVYTTENKSRYDISHARWQVWVIVDGQKSTEADTSAYGDYGRSLNGLDSGKSGRMKESTFLSRTEVHSVGIRRAKSVVVQMELEPKSVDDLQGQRILPKFDVSRETYTSAISDAKKSIDGARKLKGTMG